MKHSFILEPKGRTGLVAHVTCGHCGLYGEFIRFGRWATPEFLRKRAIEWLRSHQHQVKPAA